MHPWIQKFYPALGLGSGERLLWHFQTPVLYWINLSLRCRINSWSAVLNRNVSALRTLGREKGNKHKFFGTTGPLTGQSPLKTQSIRKYKEGGGCIPLSWARTILLKRWTGTSPPQKKEDPQKKGDEHFSLLGSSKMHFATSSSR